MNGILYIQLLRLLNQEITVAVGEELITGTLESVNQDFLTLTESTDTYERESTTRIIVLEQISYIQVPMFG
ncbi:MULTISPECIES: hypothetical protein [Solibacillus]|uniref:hypothetical protein n=1 Tax=Solibacillus TaxID=648800 RepID=UPI0020410880|nr:hypothetical protein [Solibacillus isronensis]MCM3723404.1 hypothetical protein [Solibacillus isronensis]